jgi:hypothetical protein
MVAERSRARNNTIDGIVADRLAFCALPINIPLKPSLSAATEVDPKVFCVTVQF